MSKQPQPTQPLYWQIPTSDEDRVAHLRFQQNALVRMLLDHGRSTGLGLERLAALVDLGAASRTDYDQLLQLIGYSYDGAAEMEHFEEPTLKRAMDAFVALGGDPENPPKKEEHGT